MKITTGLVAGCVFAVLLVVGVIALMLGGLGYGYYKMNEQPTIDPNAPTPAPELFIDIGIPDDENWVLIEPGVCSGDGIAAEVQEGHSLTLNYANANALASTQTFELRSGVVDSGSGEGCMFRTSFPLADFEEVEITIGDITATCDVSQFSQNGYDVSGELMITSEGTRCSDRPEINEPVTPISSPQSWSGG